MSFDEEGLEAASEPVLAGTHILVVEDTQPVVRVIERVLRGAGCEVTTVDRIEAAKSILGQTGFDAAVVDIGLPDGDGFELVEVLRRSQRPCAAVFTTGEPTADRVKTSIASGVTEFLFKPFRAPMLLASVSRAVDATRGWRARLRLVGGAGASPRVRPVEPTPLELGGTVETLTERGGLTTRESQTLELLLRGFRNDEIAYALGISGSTVKYHVRNILRKLQLDTRVDLLSLLIG